MIPGRTASRGMQPVSPLAWFQPSPSQFAIGGQGQQGAQNGPGAEYSLPTPESLTSQPFAAFHSSTTPSGTPQNNQNGHNGTQSFAPGFHPGLPFYGGNGAGGMGGMSNSVPMGMNMGGGNGANAWRGSTPSNGGMGISPSEVSIHPGHHHSHSHSIGHAKKPSATASELDMLSTSLPVHHGSPVSAGPGQSDPLTVLSEKRRRRRESHNAVERRRRDNINERISELAGLIPSALFECDSPLPLPTAQSLSVIVPGITGEPGSELPADLSALNTDGAQNTPSLNHDELFAMCEEGEEFTMASANGNNTSSGMVKKDPSEDGDNKLGGGGIGGANGQDATIKANKGMILRKSVEYIRYLQQLVSMQASRSRDLEERNRHLESELGIEHSPDDGPSTPSLNGNGHSHALSQQSEMLADVPEGVEGEEDEERGRRRERKGELNGLGEHEQVGSMEREDGRDTAMEE
ncbi:HLH-domain-containing protein [Coniophora puteana RWD-64-598 SS2]|uniref:HLH-domain-containing protein n=1 Tax=Coniophora puteana (strain RWD-64-598) TaxID=741705 RepID=R7SEX5_CONPW|nr:HLH-domain-containing protein [Coniophora puteana RWD-64-598 SS2]EIW74430.1 HLH-domain-containing protein [Coniophora puteana RWD-64-598 SS2]